MELKFVNEPELDFSLAEHQEGMRKALEYVDSKKGETYPLIINGEKIYAEKTIDSINPAIKNELIGKVAAAETKHAEDAIQTAAEAFKTWSRTSAEERVKCILKLIELLKENRYELIAWMTEENGKNWGEADGEICETIDFALAYACGMLNLDKGLSSTLIPSDKENRQCFYIPIGVGVAVAPWNFPISLIGGMVLSAVVTGNTIVMKPSSDTPIVAYRFAELMQECGIPKGVVNFITGSGRSIGDYLVGHPKTRFINFTGSKSVGLHISELSGKTAEGQIWIKRIVAEMGGKNAIVVDNTADIEEAAAGIVSSAFSLQGQKCSACSRLIAHEDIYDELLKKVTEKAKQLEKGLGRDNKDFGPVMSQSAYNGIVEYIEIGKKEGNLVLGGTYDDSVGFFIDPTIIEVDRKAVIANEEIFGPVLAVMKYKDIEEAIDIANSTEYALTGALYSKDKQSIEKAVKEFHVGNLYINHKSTGAVVMQNPFGGFNMSGTDAKTGTDDYLRNFLQLKSVTEVIV